MADMNYCMFDGWGAVRGNIQNFPDKTMTQKEWEKYLVQIDSVEEEIRKQIEQEGEQNLLRADKEREKRRQNWSEQWEEFLENTKLIKSKIEKACESDHHMLVSKVPYNNLMENGMITYNGVSFNCDEVNGAICLGDMSNPDDVLVIPLSNGGVLKVNRNNMSELGKAMGMFSPEDVCIILRTIAEEQKVRSVEYEIAQEENEVTGDLIK